MNSGDLNSSPHRQQIFSHWIKSFQPPDLPFFWDSTSYIVARQASTHFVTKYDIDLNFHDLSTGVEHYIWYCTVLGIKSRALSIVGALNWAVSPAAKVYSLHMIDLLVFFVIINDIIERWYKYIYFYSYELTVSPILTSCISSSIKAMVCCSLLWNQVSWILIWRYTNSDSKKFTLIEDIKPFECMFYEQIETGQLACTTAAFSWSSVYPRL